MRYYYAEDMGLFACETEFSSESFTEISEREYNDRVAQAVNNREVPAGAKESDENVWDGR